MHQSRIEVCAVLTFGQTPAREESRLSERTKLLFQSPLEQSAAFKNK